MGWFCNKKTNLNSIFYLYNISSFITLDVFNRLPFPVLFLHASVGGLFRSIYFNIKVTQHDPQKVVKWDWWTGCWIETIIGKKDMITLSRFIIVLSFFLIYFFYLICSLLLYFAGELSPIFYVISHGLFCSSLAFSHIIYIS